MFLSPTFFLLYLSSFIFSFFIPLPSQALFLLLNVHCLYILQFSFFLSFFTRMSFLFASSPYFPVVSHRSVISTVYRFSLLKFLSWFLSFFKLFPFNIFFILYAFFFIHYFFSILYFSIYSYMVSSQPIFHHVHSFIYITICLSIIIPSSSSSSSSSSTKCRKLVCRFKVHFPQIRSSTSSQANVILLSSSH
ncbi:unnamed protein product [Acanthosepion pharaonis]|uniref:Uncharacterized protein n=1 Tax=Acanthosepion pharaonis TaxID=158019 RepID=A0A812BUB6_ACAPH|nr:unnamed protein product [Sepia pharaonis]